MRDPVADLLERARSSFPPPPDVRGDLTRRRQRKHRNERIGAAAVALIVAVGSVLVLTRVFATDRAVVPIETGWAKSFRTEGHDGRSPIAASDAAIFVATDTTLEPNDGHRSDVELISYDASGRELWSVVFGSASIDDAESVVATETAEYVIAREGHDGALLARFDTDGHELWRTEFPIPGAISGPPLDLSVTGNSIYVSGASERTDGNFVRAFDNDGNDLWEVRVPSYAWTVTSDATGVYVASVATSWSGQRITKWDPSGTELWSKDIAPPADGAIADLVTGGDALFAVGQTQGELFVTRLDADGDAVWTRRIGDATASIGMQATADATGVYVAAFAADESGRARPFVEKFGPDGDVVWTRRSDASAAGEASIGVAALDRTPFVHWEVGAHDIPQNVDWTAYVDQLIDDGGA